MIWIFDNYRLDTDNAALWRGDEQIELRPKTFDVLRYLVEHAGELVRKEDLLESVWQNSYVVEGVLTTSMSELRKVFGDTAKNQRFIATVYRRGYRFVASVDENESADDAPQSDERPAAAAGRAEGTVYRFPLRRGFVGRERECARLVLQLCEDARCRLLTLVGAGGIGKTRLALAVLRQISELDDQPFAGGIYAVALQSLDGSDDFFAAVADALELQYSGDGELQQHLHDYLAAKNILLLLDNFEHLMQHEAALTAMLAAAPGLKILLTSRESLAIGDAWFHPVEGLEIDDSPDADAVQLFARAASRNQPEFDLEEKLPAVLRICRLVEGMPLALELAAGWLKMLSMDEVADEIEKGIDILADDYGSDGDRHRSVRAVILETWQHLTESERTLLKQLSIFRGGADRAAITAIIGAGLPLLARLVNKALLRTTHQRRYRMHELIRQFAEQELQQDETRAIEARDRHADYYLSWLAEKNPGLRGPAQAETCRDIQANLDNLRSAWRWAVERRRLPLLRKALRTLSLFSDFRGYFGDALALFELALDMLAGSDDAAAAELASMMRVRSAILNFRLSRYDTALALFLPELESTGDDYERTLILRFLGDYRFSHAGHCSAGQARQYLRECLALCEKNGNVHLRTECLRELAILYTNLYIDIELSRRYAEESVELARSTGRPDLLAESLDVLAWTSNHRGDYAAAEALWLEVRDIARESGNRSIEALATNWLGWSAWSVGGARLEQARELFDDALNRYRELGDRASQSMTYADLATVMIELGDFDRARDLCGHGLRLAQQIGRDDHYVYNLYTLGAAECGAGNL